MAINVAALAAITQLIAGVGGAALKISGARSQAKALEFEAQYAQRVHEFNAAVALQNVKLILASAQLERERAGKFKTAFLGQQRAAFAKAGVRTTEGTPFQVLVESATELELDIQTDFFNAQVAAHEQRTQAALDRVQGSVARFNQIMAQQRRRLAPFTIGLSAAPDLIQSGVTLANALTPAGRPAGVSGPLLKSGAFYSGGR